MICDTRYDFKKKIQQQQKHLLQFQFGRSLVLSFCTHASVMHTRASQVLKSC